MSLEINQSFIINVCVTPIRNGVPENYAEEQLPVFLNILDRIPSISSRKVKIGEGIYQGIKEDTYVTQIVAPMDTVTRAIAKYAFDNQQDSALICIPASCEDHRAVPRAVFKMSKMITKEQKATISQILHNHGFGGATFIGKKFFIQNIPDWDGICERAEFNKKISAIFNAIEEAAMKANMHFEYYDVTILNQLNYNTHL